MNRGERRRRTENKWRQRINTWFGMGRGEWKGLNIFKETPCARSEPLELYDDVVLKKKKMPIVEEPILTDKTSFAKGLTKRTSTWAEFMHSLRSPRKCAQCGFLFASHWYFNYTKKCPNCYPRQLHQKYAQGQ